MSPDWILHPRDPGVVDIYPDEHKSEHETLTWGEALTMARQLLAAARIAAAYADAPSDVFWELQAHADAEVAGMFESFDGRAPE